MSLSNSMRNATVGQQGEAGLERLCMGSGREQIIHDVARHGVERMEAAFAGEAFAPHRHDTYAIGLTLRGVQSFWYRGEKRFSLPGNVIILHPDELHDGAAGGDDVLRYRMLYLEPSRLAPALGTTGLPFVSDPVVQHPGLARLMQSVLSDIGGGLDELEIDGFIAQLAPLLAELSTGAGASQRPLPVPALNRVRDFLAAHADENIPSQTLETLSGLDRFALARSFRALFGTTPHRFLIMRRLANARSLVAKGTPLANIAAETGFADQAHLTRHFKKAYGMTPGRWAELTRR